MKKLKTRVMGLLLLLICAQTVSVTATPQGNFLVKAEALWHTPEVLIQDLYLNNKPVENMGKAYVNESHQVMIPLKSVMEALEKRVVYNPVSNQVTIKGDQENPEVVLDLENGQVTLNGTPYLGQGSGTILDQRTYLPLHWLVEFYGYQVYCEEVTRSVYINRDYAMLPEDYKGFRRIENLPKPTFISHAGGMAGELTHTNSLEAIEDSLARENYFVELDFLFTTDNQVVLGHNWGLMSHLMNLSDFPVSYETFMNSNLAGGLTQLDMAGLVEFMDKEERLYVITDAKENNLQLLSLIATQYPSVRHRFIPQVYDEEEYNAATTLGYKHIIYSLYQVYRTDDQVLKFATRYKPYAITMAAERVSSGLAEMLKAANVYTFTHTINTEEELILHQKMGVDGVYTDALSGTLLKEPTGSSRE